MLLPQVVTACRGMTGLPGERAGGGSNSKEDAVMRPTLTAIIQRGGEVEEAESQQPSSSSPFDSFQDPAAPKPQPLSGAV